MEEFQQHIRAHKMTKFALFNIFEITHGLKKIVFLLFIRRRSVPYFSKICSKLLIFDRPGFGLTSRPLIPQNISGENSSRNPYSPKFSVEILKAFLENCQINDAVLIGLLLCVNFFKTHE